MLDKSENLILIVGLGLLGGRYAQVLSQTRLPCDGHRPQPARPWTHAPAA